MPDHQSAGHCHDSASLCRAGIPGHWRSMEFLRVYWPVATRSGTHREEFHHVRVRVGGDLLNDTLGGGYESIVGYCRPFSST